MGSWLSQFESLGNNCEFGFVQRALGYEESSLLRWAFVDDIDALQAGVRNRFEGLFEFDNLTPAGGGTMVRDRASRIAFHSKMRSVEENGEWLFVDSIEARKALFEIELGKINHLLKKFNSNITRADRIYVLKRNDGLTHDEAMSVLDALAERGDARLLFVTEANNPEERGEVTMINPRLVWGRIDRFAPYSQSDDVSLACWETILRRTVNAVAKVDSRIVTPAKVAGLVEETSEAVAPLDEEARRLVKAFEEFVPPDRTNLFFDPIVYATRYAEITGECPFSNKDALAHWLAIGRRLRIVPSLFFDEKHYLASQSDVREAGYFGFVHFLLHGMSEGRSPNCWFNVAQYRYHLGSDNASYSHFLHHGLENGVMPSDVILTIMRTVDPNARLSMDLYLKFLRLRSPVDDGLSAEGYERLAMIFAPHWHASGEISSAIRTFLHYAREELWSGISPGPLFDGEVYRARAIAAELPLEGLLENPVVHWLKYGCSARVVPTNRFDETFYLQSNPDIAASDSWSFVHFALHGVYEGRLGTKDRRFRQTLPPTESGTTRFSGQHKQWLAHDFPLRGNSSEGFVPERIHRRLGEVLNSEGFSAIFSDAQALDPTVGTLDDIADFLLLPYYDDLAGVHRELHKRLPQERYDTVICVPWIRLGGADLVAGLLAGALLRVRPFEKVLILRTDQPHFERADWLPKAADVVHASDLFGSLDLPRAQHLLKVMLKGIQVKRVMNVNSRLCWTMFRDHGAFMAESFYTYAYLFCWDHLPSGLRAGYPAEFFADTIDHLSGCMTDTVYLRDQLSQMYCLPQTTKDRIKPLFTPAQTALRPTAVARDVASVSEPAARRRILWGGRLDRQKRFDLVIELARRMPDIEFWCWGAALLDKAPNFAALPSNVIMQGTFASFDELPLTSAALWLFTALWEGMPTTLIELATRGVGVVASAVGGVPELITPETGWPVPEGESAPLYEQVLRKALADPEEVARRAEALQQRVGSIYNVERYAADIKAMLSGEER